jgi:hypothetical protein
VNDNWAIKHGAQHSSTSMIKLLLDFGANIDHRVIKNTIKNAIGSRDISMIKLLIDYGADISNIQMNSTKQKNYFFTELFDLLTEQNLPLRQILLLLEKR